VAWAKVYLAKALLLESPKRGISCKELRGSLASELLTHISSNSPEFFEHLVVKLLVKMGYGGSIKDAGQAIGRSGDEGINGIIKEDKLGLDVIYIQANRLYQVVAQCTEMDLHPKRVGNI
jgi:restriction endonuclease Mrr